MERFGGKYRIESNRLPGWDYSSDGLYFITIVTAGRECVFGHIENDNMILSDFGEIANNEWYKSFEIRQELFPDEFILMPNHLHAIVVLNKNRMDNKANNDYIGNKRANGGHTNDRYTDDRQTDDGRTENDRMDDGRTTRRYGRYVDTHGRAYLPPVKSTNPIPFKRKPKSISSFVAGYKSAVVNQIDDFIDLNKLNVQKYNRNNPLWQSNYHDHIIRDNASYQRIKNYIINNPIRWTDDKLYYN